MLTVPFVTVIGLAAHPAGASTPNDGDKNGYGMCVGSVGRINVGICIPTIRLPLG
jgi:hypothetical protein